MATEFLVFVITLTAHADYINEDEQVALHG